MRERIIRREFIMLILKFMMVMIILMFVMIMIIMMTLPIIANTLKKEKGYRFAS